MGLADSYGTGSQTTQEREPKPDSRMMIPESRSDQSYGGYGGIGRMSSNGVPPSNNAMEIFSRFRPIAPKPSTAKPGESAGSAPSDPPSSSTLSFERTSGGKAVSSERSRAKRNRKRNGSEPLLPPTRRAKRGQTPSKQKGSPPVGGIQKAVEQFAPDQSRLYPMPPNSTGAEYRTVKGGTFSSPHGGEVAPPDYVSVGEAPEAHGAGWVRPDRRRYSNGFGAFKMPPTSNEWLSTRGSGVPEAYAAPANDGPVAEEPSFMGRAAGASNSQPFFGREVNGVEKLRGYERGFENYPNGGSSDEYLERTVPARALDFMRNSSPYMTYGTENNVRTNDQISYAPSKGESEVISDGNSREPNLVTLSLLPDTPSQSSSSPVAITPTTSTSTYLPCLELTMITDSRDWKETNSEASEELHKLTLFSSSYEEQRRNSFCGADGDRSQGTSSSSEEGARASRILEEPLNRIPRVPASSRDSDESNLSVTDTNHMEQQYSASSDPMMLLDDLNGEILWSNSAYWKAVTERNQRLGKAKEAGAPYLDVLGIPTKLSSFDFQTLQGTRTRANLWGFLKKFMGGETSSRVDSLPEGSRGDGGSESKETRTPEQRSKSSSTTEEDFPGSSQIIRPKPITPQPIRPVGSTLTLGGVISMDHFASPITDNLERVKEELESKPTPSVITDHKNRVNWVNTAYKQMVGQPECSWLASTMGNTAKDVPQQSRLMGEVMLICDQQISKMAAHFSCKVNVRWTNEGDENCVTVPAEVSRIENEKRAVMFVWKLDPWSSARLQNGARRVGDNRHSPQSHSACQ